MWGNDNILSTRSGQTGHTHIHTHTHLCIPPPHVMWSCPWGLLVLIKKEFSIWVLTRTAGCSVLKLHMHAHTQAGTHTETHTNTCGSVCTYTHIFPFTELLMHCVTVGLLQGGRIIYLDENESHPFSYRLLWTHSFTGIVCCMCSPHTHTEDLDLIMNLRSLLFNVLWYLTCFFIWLWFWCLFCSVCVSVRVCHNIFVLCALCVCVHMCVCTGQFLPLLSSLKCSNRAYRHETSVSVSWSQLG